MKHIQDLPWKLVLDDNEVDAALFSTNPQADRGFECEMNEPENNTCHAAPFLIGSSDGHDPKFCFSHYFGINDGDGKTNYKIVPLETV